MFFLDNVDAEEAKTLFETNYSHIYFILYDTFIQAEANLKQKGIYEKIDFKKLLLICFFYY